MKKIHILDYGAGNIFSLSKAIERVQAQPVLTADPDILNNADYLIVPGVGAAAYAMHQIREAKIEAYIKERTKPTLGICLGMQLFCAYSEEGDTPCLGIFPLKVQKIQAELKVPHMGWNQASITTNSSKLTKGLSSDPYFYFVHSFAAEVSLQYTTLACTYGMHFSAALEYQNFFATQFHPEKSGKEGMKILENFVNL